MGWGGEVSLKTSPHKPEHNGLLYKQESATVTQIHKTPDVIFLSSNPSLCLEKRVKRLTEQGTTPTKVLTDGPLNLGELISSSSSSSCNAKEAPAVFVTVVPINKWQP